jgi:alanine racemase
MSDEADKTFALEQYRRFGTLLSQMEARNLTVKYRHLCNSGGFLDLPMAHLDMVRCGILPLGVYPSQVCRRLPGIAPVMRVKCRLAAIQNIQPGDTIGYGMRYQAESPRCIGILPIGYGDGFPRLRNQGWVLLHGRKAPIVGANAMDAIMVDLTEIPQAKVWDEIVLVGRQAPEEISVHHVAQWGQTVSYDILCRWRARLPRVYLDSTP